MQVRYQTAPTARERRPYHRANSPLGCTAGSQGQTPGNLPTIGAVTPNQRPPHEKTTVNPLPHLEDHLTRIAEEGYTILPEAIEPELVDEIDEALLKLEHALRTVPADNLFEGAHTLRVYNLLVH